MTYTKLFSSITESTIWMEDNPTRLVWIAMLAMADKYGRVWGSMPGLANRARVEQQECEAALQKFLSPDKHSRTPDNEGRRIEIIRGGWRLLNHGYYRDLQDTESQKAYKAAWIREKRRKQREANRLGVDVGVDSVDKSRLKSIEVDDIAEASPSPKADTSLPLSPKGHPASIEEVISYGKHPGVGLAEQDCRDFWDYYEARGWRTSGDAVSNWQALLRSWKNKKRSIDEQRNNSQANGASQRGSGQNTSDRRRAKADECRDEGITIPIIRVEPIAPGMVPGASQVP